MRSFLNIPIAPLAAALSLACAAEPNLETEVAPADDDLAALRAFDGELAPDAQGAAVRAVHAYLERYGYLPNKDLARTFPAWRPFAAAPADPSVYDANTAMAILALQRNYGLPPTGILDDGTRAAMLEARCGTPEIHDVGPKEKWELQGSSWGTNSLTWRVLNANDITLTQARNAAQQAFAAWASFTGFTFTEITSGTANIQIQFSTNNPSGNPWGSGTLASTFYPAFGGDAYFNPAINWSSASPTPSGNFDFNSILLHELGHALGINHSSYLQTLADNQRASMYPTFLATTQRRTLKPDDGVAALAKNIAWLQFDNSTTDLDVDDGPLFHHTYALGGASVSGGREVWLLANGSWSILTGQGAVRVASNGGGNTWIVQSDGDIYQRVSGSWVLRPGCGTDIAVGPDNSVWMIGCNAVSGGFSPNKWNGSSWDQASGGAVRISVGRRAPNDIVVPWIVQNDGDIFRRSSNSATSGSWGSALPGAATDIAASDSGFTWVIGANGVGGGFGIHVWNEQAALAAGSPQPQALAQWVAVPGGAVNITSDSFGRPYVANNAEQAFWTF